MNYLYGRSAAAAMLPAALAVRLFVGMAVDFPVAMNAAWMCPLIGFILYLPFALALSYGQKIGVSSAWENICGALPVQAVRALEAVFALLLAYDAAASVRLTASSSNIIALGDVTVHLLVVPLGIVAAAVVMLGGDALGDGSRIALRMAPLFALIVLLIQVTGYHLGWLTPLLGAGTGCIIRGSIYCAGCMALLSLSWLPAVPDRHKNRPIRYVLLSTVGASILLLTQQMSFPVMPETEFTRAARIELVLSNGRMSLYPQFILNILWFGGLLLLLAVETVASAAYLHRIFPGMRMWLLALLEAGAISAAAIYNPGWLKKTELIIQLLFPLLATLLVLPLLGILIGKRGKTSCQK